MADISFIFYTSPGFIFITIINFGNLILSAWWLFKPWKSLDKNEKQSIKNLKYILQETLKHNSHKQQAKQWEL